MKSVVVAAVALAVTIALVTLVIYATKLYESQAMQWVFLVIAIAVNVACIYWALSRTAATSGYGGQFVNTLVFGVLAAVLIFVVSFALASAFPQALEFQREAGLDRLDQMQGLPEEAREMQVRLIERMTTPTGSAIPGAIGTFVTSLVAGAIVSFYKRKK